MINVPNWNCGYPRPPQCSTEQKKLLQIVQTREYNEKTQDHGYTTKYKVQLPFWRLNSYACTIVHYITTIRQGYLNGQTFISRDGSLTISHNEGVSPNALQSIPFLAKCRNTDIFVHENTWEGTNPGWPFSLKCCTHLKKGKLVTQTWPADKKDGTHQGCLHTNYTCNCMLSTLRDVWTTRLAYPWRRFQKPHI